MRADAGHPRSSHPAGRALRQIAVISDGSAPGPGQPGPSSEVDLAGDVAILEGLARVPAIAHTVAGADIAQFATRIGQLPDSVAAVLVTRTDPVRTRAVQRRVEQGGGRPVLSDEDAAAIALTAAATVYLRRIGRDRHRSRVLVVGASAMPILATLLLGCGFRDITLWNSVDAPRFPLSRAARDADIVLDLLGGPGVSGLVMDRPEGSVITGNGLDGRFLAAPGLLRALAQHPPGTFALGIDLFGVCADALAAATPIRRRLTDLRGDQAITDAIAAAVHRAAIRPGTGNDGSQWTRRPRHC